MLSKGYLILLALGVCQTTQALSLKKKYGQNANQLRDFHLGVGNVQEKYLKMDVDHTNNHGEATSATYQMRYLIDESASAQMVNPPILFYCGNEGDVWGFYNNSGFVTKTLPPQVNGLVLFGEHRYYGKSRPFGNSSFTPDNVKYLTVDQTMLDYVELIKTIKASNVNYTNSPVIAFGGSYGGMLASWMRMKYPHVIQGAHAASAPILFFTGVTSPYAYNDLATRDYAQADPNCPINIRRAYSALDRLGNNATNFGLIKKTFKTCTNVTQRSQVDAIIAETTDGFGSMAMVDYPYPAGLLGALPANPVKLACDSISKMTPASDADLINLLATANQVYFNSSGSLPCFEIPAPQQIAPAGALDDKGWDYQACQEMVLPIAQNGVTDMFLPQMWNADAFVAACNKNQGVNPQFAWALDTFGGRNIQKDFQHVSNVIFSNGLLDPWRAGGVTKKFNNDPSNLVIQIPRSAHHLDLRENNPADPSELTAARSKITILIKKWIAAFNPVTEEIQ